MLQLDSYALPALVLLAKATLILGVALGAAALLQRTSAGVRHLVWLTAIAGVLVLPAMAAWGPVRVKVLPAASGADGGALGGSRVGNSKPAGFDAAPSFEVAPAALPAPATTADAGAPIGFGTAIAIAWAVVAAGLLLRLTWGAWSVRRIIARARPLDDPEWEAPRYEIADRLELAAAPRLLRSDDVKMPFAAGLFSSAIVLPAESDGWNAERRTAVLIHELGHVRRRDLIGHTLGRVACALGWFHPLVWTAARRLRAESERACDDLALVFGARPSDYAEHLLDIVSCVRDHNTPAVALAMAHRREFEGRMLAILDPELRRRGMGRVQTAGLVGGLAALALVVGAAAPVPRETQISSQPESLSHPERSEGAMTQQVPQTAAQTAADTARWTRVPVPDPRVAVKSRDGGLQLAFTDSTSDVGVRVEPGRVRVGVRTSQRTKPFSSSGAVSGSSSSSSSSSNSSTSVTRNGTGTSISTSSSTGTSTSTSTSVTAPDGREISASASASARASAQASARSESPAVASALAVASGDSAKSGRRAEVLAKMLRTDTSAALRRIAAWGLNEYGDNKAAVEALAAAVTGDANAGVREMAAWSLAEADDHPAAGPALVKALKQDKDPKVRHTAVWALGEVGDENTVEALVPVLSDADAEMRELAAWAIGECEPKKAPAALVSLLNDKTPDVRLSAAWALYQIEDGSAAGAIEAAYNRETVPEVREGLIRALGAMGDGAVDVLQRLVSSPDPKIRRFAVTALAGGNASGPWPWPRPEPRPFPDEGDED
jgi:beta-lactamase regulating signal transducer with metallopeptidase domain/HEAT repeat protein